MIRIIAFLMLFLGMVSCHKEKNHHIVRVAANQSPQSLDPRSARSLTDATVLNMIYEGLMRQTASGGLAPGVAETVEISPDRTTYTFHLRDSHWSNGDPVTAQDFIRSWLGQLKPGAPAPNAFVFDVIKDGRAAREGAVPIEQVGVSAPDAHTLVVQLEQPTPYFLDLTAFYAMFPIHDEADQEAASATNGPFRLVSFSPTNELVVERNPDYWAATAVKLEGVTLAFLDEETSLSLFNTDALDWIGSPLSTIPPDAFDALEATGQLQAFPTAATHFLRFQVTKAPLNHVKLRQALALAINRRELIDNVLHGSQQAAMSLVPSSSKWQTQRYFADHDTAKAKKLYSEALEELHQLPPMTLIYTPTPRNQQLVQALQQQWYQTLGLWVELQAMESKLFYDKLKSEDYQIANGSWFADFDDPINFLEVFEAKDNGTNNTGWENSRYRSLLEQSSLVASSTERLQLLQQAERILMTDMPIAPIFFYSLNYLKAPAVHDIVISPIGIQMFRDGYKGEKQ